MISSKTWRFIHKWTAIIIGLFILIWTISGIVMELPGRWFTPGVVQTNTPIAYRQAILSPAEAITKIEENLNQKVNINSVQLMGIQGQPLYRVFMGDLGMRMVDATSGNLISISPEMAESLARPNVGQQAKLKTLEQLNKHDALYPFGELPTYRIRFEGDGSNIYYVSLTSGAVSRSNSITRIRAAITSLHTFEPVRLFTDTDAIRKGMLAILSLVGVIVAITGYIIFLLPYFRQKSQRRTDRKTKAGAVESSAPGSTN